MKFNELGRSFFRKKLQIRSNFVTTCTTKGTRGAKSPVDATFSGRSMVEMLGVLAIIGVLSVGALSGYSKAILKYRLNKSSQELSYLLSVSFEYLQSKTPKNGNSNTDNIIPYLITLDSVPEYMLKDGYTDRLFDSLENQIVIQDTTDWRRMYFTINENLTASNETNIAYCIQMMNVTKLYYDNISSASLLTDDGNTTIYKGTHNSNSAYPRLDTSDSLTICKNGFKRLMILLQK